MLPMSRTGPKPIRPSIVPPLQPGDHLTRAEFERRYDATPNLHKAELIEGVVFMPPPVSHQEHSAPHGWLVTLIGTYYAATPGTMFGDNGSCRLDLANMPQPDVYLLIAPEHGGQAKIDEDDYVAGAPEFVGEVAASSVSYDLHVKLNVYRRNGVREYLVWRTQDREFNFFVLQDGEFRAVPADDRGIIRSAVFPGLWISTAALMARDLAGALDVMRQGIASPEHAAFVTRLNP
jgi:Uma2 family endonuclease